MLQRILNLIFRPIFGYNLSKGQELRKTDETQGKFSYLNPSNAWR